MLTRLVFLAILLLPGAGFGGEPQETEPQTVHQTKYVATLGDGTQLGITSFRKFGNFVHMSLPDGGMVAYRLEDVQKIEESNLGRDEQEDYPEHPAETRSTSSQSGPDHASKLSLAGGTLKLPDPDKREITLIGNPDESNDSKGSFTVRQDDPPPINRADDYVEALKDRQAAEHAMALTEYEKRLAELASVRDDLVAMDNRASYACEGFTTVIGVGAVDLYNEYGGFWSGTFSWAALIFNFSSPYCQSLLADCDRLAVQVTSGLRDLADFARKNGVEPGEARSRLNAYALNIR